jgi:hypothetical protein
MEWIRDHPGQKRDTASTGGIYPQPFPVPLPVTLVPFPYFPIPFSHSHKYRINVEKQTDVSVRFHPYSLVADVVPLLVWRTQRANPAFQLRAAGDGRTRTSFRPSSVGRKSTDRERARRQGCRPLLPAAVHTRLGQFFRFLHGLRHPLTTVPQSSKRTSQSKVWQATGVRAPVAASLEPPLTLGRPQDHRSIRFCLPGRALFTGASCGRCSTCRAATRKHTTTTPESRAFPLPFLHLEV